MQWRVQRSKIFELPSRDGRKSGVTLRMDMVNERHLRAQAIAAAR
jgi:hypothetical protein